MNELVMILFWTLRKYGRCITHRYKFEIRCRGDQWKSWHIFMYSLYKQEQRTSSSIGPDIWDIDIRLNSHQPKCGTGIYQYSLILIFIISFFHRNDVIIPLYFWHDRNYYGDVMLGCWSNCFQHLSTKQSRDKILKVMMRFVNLVFGDIWAMKLR